MFPLPYDFDTTTPWRQIVKITAAIAAALIAATILAAAMGNWGAAAGIAVCVAILGFVVRRATRFPGVSFGAMGRLTLTRSRPSQSRSMEYHSGSRSAATGSLDSLPCGSCSESSSSVQPAPGRMKTSGASRSSVAPERQTSRSCPARWAPR
jgi:hypothetical protein